MSTNLAIQINSIFAACILLTAFGLLVQRRMLGLVHVFALQGLFLALSTALVAYITGAHHLYISALLALLIKVIFIPYLLYRLIHKLKVQREVEPLINLPATMLLGIVIVVFSYYMTTSVSSASTMVTRSTIALAMATVMLGLLMMITRKKAITQTIGFLALDNGLIFMTTSATSGMPLVVELGIALDVLIAAVIFGIFFLHISSTFETLDLKEMETLREDTER
ncbi:MAG: formate hydrogenlyase [Thermodesulfobacteriota bacterium]